MANIEPWGSDAPISLPQPSKSKILNDLDDLGFAFSEFGICHSLTDVDRENMINPFYGPQAVDDGI